MHGSRGEITNNAFGQQMQLALHAKCMYVQCAYPLFSSHIKKQIITHTEDVCIYANLDIAQDTGRGSLVTFFYNPIDLPPSQEVWSTTARGGGGICDAGCDNGSVFRAGVYVHVYGVLCGEVQVYLPDGCRCQGEEVGNRWQCIFL